MCNASLQSSCPERLELSPALVDVLSELKNVVKIPIQNSTRNVIFHTKRTVLCTLKEGTEVKSVWCLTMSR